jgi:hypothetical protein
MRRQVAWNWVEAARKRAGTQTAAGSHTRREGGVYMLALEYERASLVTVLSRGTSNTHQGSSWIASELGKHRWASPPCLAALSIGDTLSCQRIS